MKEVEQLRTWCESRGVKLHERVLGNGHYHVWLYQVYRFDCEHRDLAFACRMMLAKLRHTFHWSFRGAPLTLESLAGENNEPRTFGR